MPHNVEPKVYLIGHSIGNPDAIEKWLNDLGVSDERVDELANIGVQEKSDAEQIVELAGRRCYKSFEVGLNANVTKIRENIVQYIDNILKVGHGSVLEHVTFNFAIENVSRVFTGEMNRHRAGMAISEGSMRYIRFEDIPYWIPTSIQGEHENEESIDNHLRLKLIDFLLEGVKDNFDEADYTKICSILDPAIDGTKNRYVGEWNTEEKKCFSRAAMGISFLISEFIYGKMVKNWGDELSESSKFKAKKDVTSMMRRIIPMGVATGGLWTGNIRALRHVFNMRCAPEAEEEIRLVGIQMLEILKAQEPTFFRDFKKQEDGTYKPEYKKV